MSKISGPDAYTKFHTSGPGEIWNAGQAAAVAKACRETCTRLMRDINQGRCKPDHGALFMGPLDRVISGIEAVKAWLARK